MNGPRIPDSPRNKPGRAVPIILEARAVGALLLMLSGLYMLNVYPMLIPELAARAGRHAADPFTALS